MLTPINWSLPALEGGPPVHVPDGVAALEVVDGVLGWEVTGLEVVDCDVNTVVDWAEEAEDAVPGMHWE